MSWTRSIPAEVSGGRADIADGSATGQPPVSDTSHDGSGQLTEQLKGRNQTMRALRRGMLIATMALVASVPTTTAASAQPNPGIGSPDQERTTHPTADGPTRGQTTKDASSHHCPDGFFCLYANPNFTDVILMIPGDDDDAVSDHPLARSDRNRASSYTNYAGECVELRDYTPWWNVTTITYDGTGSDLFEGHPRGGSWNDKVDEIAMDDCY